VTSDPAAPEAPLTVKEAADLRRLVGGIIRAQGNRFLKELLRKNDITLPSDKAGFESSLLGAIDAGKIRLSHVQAWLDLVEGWGNQHVYLFRVLPSLRASLDEQVLLSRVRQVGLDALWGAPTILEFPETPTLTSIKRAGERLSLVWQESSPDWSPVKEKNYIAEEGLDTFEYRAYRRVEERAFMRFEARLDRKLAALFVATPIRDEKHQQAIAEAMRVVDLLLDKKALERGRLKIERISRNVDQGNRPTGKNLTLPIKTQRSRLMSGGAYVEWGANSSDRAYWEEPAIQNVRASVKTAQLERFRGTEGVFTFQATEPTDAKSPAAGLTRPLRVQLYGVDNRIRLWAQMKEDEVWTILTMLNGYQDQV